MKIPSRIARRLRSAVALGRPILSPGPEIHIDGASQFGRVVRLHGWSEATALPGFAIRARTDKRILSANVSVVNRPDLRPHFGVAAEASWGFDAIFVADSFDEARIICLGDFMFASKVTWRVVERPSELLGKQSEAERTRLEKRFVDATKLRSGGRLLEIGSRARSGIIRREHFSHCEYVGLDVLAGANVDIVGDVHELSSLGTGKFDFIYSASVFEHLAMPWKVAVELATCLNDGGLVYTQTHQAWPLHDEPWDYWRYSQDAWRSIFNLKTGFTVLEVAYSNPCYYVPALEDGAEAKNFREQFGYLSVACLAQKTAEPSVAWAVDPRELTDTVYPV